MSISVTGPKTTSLSTITSDRSAAALAAARVAPQSKIAITSLATTSVSAAARLLDEIAGTLAKLQVGKNAQPVVADPGYVAAIPAPAPTAKDIPQLAAAVTVTVAEPVPLPVALTLALVSSPVAPAEQAKPAPAPPPAEPAPESAAPAQPAPAPVAAQPKSSAKRARTASPRTSAPDGSVPKGSSGVTERGAGVSMRDLYREKVGGGSRGESVLSTIAGDGRFISAGSRSEILAQAAYSIVSRAQQERARLSYIKQE